MSRKTRRHLTSVFCLVLPIAILAVFQRGGLSAGHATISSLQCSDNEYHVQNAELPEQQDVDDHVRVEKTSDLERISNKTNHVLIAAVTDKMRFEAVADHEVSSVAFEGVAVTDRVLSQVIHAKLESLVLSNADVISVQVLRELNKTELKSIKIEQKSNFDRAFLDALIKISHLRKIAIPRGQLSAADVAQCMKGAKKITSLTMLDCAFTLEDLEALNYPPKLESLFLLGTLAPPSIEMAKNISAHPSINTLGITVSGMGNWPSGVVEYCLDRLDIHHVVIGGNIGKEDLAALAQEDTLESITLLGVENLREEWFEDVAALSDLIGLRLVKCKQIEAVGLKKLSRSTSLKSLALNGCKPKMDEEEVKRILSVDTLSVTENSLVFLRAFFAD